MRRSAGRKKCRTFRWAVRWRFAPALSSMPDGPAAFGFEQAFAGLFRESYGRIVAALAGVARHNAIDRLRREKRRNQKAIVRARDCFIKDSRAGMSHNRRAKGRRSAASKETAAVRCGGVGSRKIIARAAGEGVPQQIPVYIESHDGYGTDADERIDRRTKRCRGLAHDHLTIVAGQDRAVG